MTATCFPTVNSVIAERIATAQRAAKRDFHGHVLRCDLNQGLYRCWRGGQPDSSFYHFYITTKPGTLIVTGDIGDLVLERTDDMLAWSRSAINSISYFAEKVVRPMATREYDPDVAEAWYYETVRDRDYYDYEHRRKLKEIVRDELGHDFNDQHAVEAAIYESEIAEGEDWPKLNNYTWNFLWCREAVKWLLAQLPVDNGFVGGDGI